MKPKLRIRSLRGVFCWLVEEGSKVYWLGPVSEWTVEEVLGGKAKNA